ncbi:MAG: threonylcarbamoyl-AMP synthase [Clostridia bacterium]|nr:threonylcarbamoyl-AMP synthase [Clostridia bacterium]
MQTQHLTDREEELRIAAALLRDGELVAIPTETVYGLAADARNGAAVASIFKAKGRPGDNPLIVHIASKEQLTPLVAEIPPVAEALAAAYWPGPLTMIFNKAPTVPDEVTAGLSTVAVRMPSHPVAQKLIQLSGCPLAAPSANRSGSPSPTDARRVAEDMDGRIAAIVDGGACEVGVESTVVSVCGDRVRLLRPGAVTVAMLEAVAGSVDIDEAVLAPLREGAEAASPGMKYKHYAPAARVVLVRGTAEAYVRYVNDKAAEGVMALCFDGEEAGLTVPYLTYGRREDPAAQAQQVFEALRQLDERGAALAYTACPSPEGIGLAVYNRLLRAAGFEVITLE